MHLLKLGIIQVLFPINLLYSSLGLEFQIFRRSYETSIHLYDPYRTEWNSSLLSCSRECYDDPMCVAFSYEDSTNRCEMNRAPSYAGSKIETGWDVYYKTGKPCRNILLKNSMAPSGIYSYRDINRRDIEIFCDFHGDYGYTFFPPQSLSNLSSLLPHYTTRSEAIIRNFRSDGSQQEATIKMLSRYESQYNLTFLLNGYFDGDYGLDEPYLTLGFVPLSFGNKKGTIQGYTVEGQDIEYTNCDTNPHSSISFFQTPLISSKLCCQSNVKSAWYDYAVPVEPGHELPAGYSYKFSVRMGGCGAGWAYDDPSKGVIGAALGLKFTLNA